MSEIDILLLAGGSSSRMRGADKLLEDVGGKTLIRDRAEMCLATSARRVIAVTAPEHAQRAAEVNDLDLAHVANDGAALGIAHSIQTALAQTDADAVVIMLADLPDLTTEDLNQIIDRAETSDALIIRGATQDGKPGHPVLIRKALFPDLMALRGDQGAAPVLKANQLQTELVQLPAQNALNDLDTPEAWAEWRAAQKEKPL